MPSWPARLEVRCSVMGRGAKLTVRKEVGNIGRDLEAGAVGTSQREVRAEEGEEAARVDEEQPGTLGGDDERGVLEPECCCEKATGAGTTVSMAGDGVVEGGKI